MENQLFADSYKHAIGMLHGVHNVKHKVSQGVLNRTWLKFPAYLAQQLPPPPPLSLLSLFHIIFVKNLNYMSTHVCIKLIITLRSKAEENFTCLPHLCITHNKNSVTTTKFV